MKKAKPPQRYTDHGVQFRRELNGAVLASFGRRAAAFLIDFSIVVLVLGAFKLPAMLSEATETDSYVMDINPFHGWELISLPVYFGVMTFMGKGRTLGKWICGIRVVSLVHEKLGLWHSVERSLGYAASFLECGFGFIQYFIHPNCQTVHDRIAETIVVRDSTIADQENAEPLTTDNLDSADMNSQSLFESGRLKRGV